MVHVRTSEQRMSRILLPSKWTNAVPDADLEIRWRRSSSPLDKRRGGGGGAAGGLVPPQIFSALRASVWSKTKGGGGGGLPAPLGGGGGGGGGGTGLPPNFFGPSGLSLV